jgi:hypothetical protein
MTPKVSRIEDQNDGVRLREVPAFAFQDIMSNLFVFRARMQAVNTREIHQEHVRLSLELGLPCPMFYRYAGEISYLLIQTGKAVKERRFS